jgi:hypothetical protein
LVAEEVNKRVDEKLKKIKDRLWVRKKL